MVQVVDLDGNALHPTARHGKVRRWLRDGLARVVCMEPFTVQLLYRTGKEKRNA